MERRKEGGKKKDGRIDGKKGGKRKEWSMERRKKGKEWKVRRKEK